MAVPTNRESDRFMLRLPDGMRDRIKTAAAENNRSMNAEIVATLEEKYPAPVSRVDELRRLVGLLDSQALAGDPMGAEQAEKTVEEMRRLLHLLQGIGPTPSEDD